MSSAFIRPSILTMNRPTHPEERRLHYRARRCTWCHGRRTLNFRQSTDPKKPLLSAPCSFCQTPRTVDVVPRVASVRGKHGSRGRTKGGRLSRPKDPIRRDQWTKRRLTLGLPV